MVSRSLPTIHFHSRSAFCQQCFGVAIAQSMSDSGQRLPIFQLRFGFQCCHRSLREPTAQMPSCTSSSRISSTQLGASTRKQCSTLSCRHCRATPTRERKLHRRFSTSCEHSIQTQSTRSTPSRESSYGLQLRGGSSGGTFSTTARVRTFNGKTAKKWCR